MAGVSDKARFYLERAAPELREFEEKEIFSRSEIRTLVTRRSAFEHLILSPGTTPSSFLSYIAWERSLNTLRAKRARRLNLSRHALSSGARASEARTFAIFERAVSKHPGSVQLWMAYLEYAAQLRASKRWRRVATRALRLHPGRAELWVLAGRRAARGGDMARARAHFLRGCRFCTGAENGGELWVEYARCEMEWLGKVEQRKAKGKGKGQSVGEVLRATEGEEEGDVIRFDEEDDEEESGGEEGELMLPDPDADVPGGKGGKRPKVFDEETKRKMEQSPALSGAIPMAIFDVARKQPFFGPAAAESFFDAFADFTNVSSQGKVVQHVLDAMEELFPNHPCTCSCRVRQPLIGVDILTAAFPKALRESLARLKGALETTEDRKVLVGKMGAWVDGILATDGLDAAIRTVLEHTKRSLESPS